MPLPAFLAPAAIGGFLKRAWPFLLAAAVGLVLLLTYCEGKRSGKAGADLAREKGNVKTLQRVNKANEAAAENRLTEQARVNKEQRELQEAVSHETDPRERRRAFHRCLRLQQSARAANREPPECVSRR